MESNNRGRLETLFFEDEYWYGGIVDKGVHMPLDNRSSIVLDMTDRRASLDQSAPFLISSKGRYIWSESPFKAEFENGKIICQGLSELVISEGHQDLKGAYIHACRQHFPFSGNLPDELFFKLPQYNTWIELQYNQTQDGILNYARGILEHGMPAGILMIDDGWSEDYGIWRFHEGKFQNPNVMIEELHEMGFKVMLWVIPVVSPDSSVFRELRAKDCLLKDSDGKIMISEWWNGYSAVLDLTKENARDFFKIQLDFLQKEYNIDGFKFDGGDAYFYGKTDVIAQEYTRAYNQFAQQYAFNELRAAWKFAGQGIVTRLQDKHHSWNLSGINCLVPNSLMQGLLGYAYHCPDMIGGGDVGSDYSQADEELIVRYAQVSALMPMMQFSLAPWRVLSEKNMSIVREAAQLHVKYGDFILKLAKEASQGLPIIRHMAFVFPDEKFETVMNQFMLGDDILVAPILTPNTYSRRVKLPKGEWKTEDRMIYQGGKMVVVDAPIERLPYFIKCR